MIPRKKGKKENESGREWKTLNENELEEKAKWFVERKKKIQFWQEENEQY